ARPPMETYQRAMRSLRARRRRLRCRAGVLKSIPRGLCARCTVSFAKSFMREISARAQVRRIGLSRLVNLAGLYDRTVTATRHGEARHSMEWRADRPSAGRHRQVLNYRPSSFMVLSTTFN